MIKLLKVSDKDKILKPEKRTLYTKEHRWIEDFPLKRQVRSQWSPVSKTLKERNLSVQNSLPNKSALQTLTRNKGFPKHTHTDGIYLQQTLTARNITERSLRRRKMIPDAMKGAENGNHVDQHTNFFLLFQ